MLDDDIHTPSYAGSFNSSDSPFLTSQFPQSPVSSLSSISRSRSPSITSYDSNINDDDDYGFGNLTFGQLDQTSSLQPPPLQPPSLHPPTLQPTLQIPNDIPDVNLIEATPIAKTPTAIEYQVKGQQVQSFSNFHDQPSLPLPTFRRPRAQSDPDTKPPSQDTQHTVGRNIGHRRCRSGGREGAGTPNYGVRLKPKYKVDHDHMKNSINNESIDDIDLNWLHKTQSVSPNSLQNSPAIFQSQSLTNSPFSSNSNLFECVQPQITTNFNEQFNNNAFNDNINSISAPYNYINAVPNDGNEQYYQNITSSNTTSNAYGHVNPDESYEDVSFNFPPRLQNDFVNVYPSADNIIPPPIINVDSITSSPSNSATQLKLEPQSPQPLPELILPPESDYQVDVKPFHGLQSEYNHSNTLITHGQQDSDNIDKNNNSRNVNANANASTNAHVHGTFNNKPILTPNPTTTRTRIASNSRRKQTADGKAPKIYVCEVPGCGSSFTRQFNCKFRHLCHILNDVLI